MISRIASFVLLSLVIVSSASAQGDIGPMQLDPYFGVNGVRTVTFPGTTNDSVTCAIVFSKPSPDHQGIPVRSPIIIGGMLRTSTPGEIRFGIARMDSGGVMTQSFGTNGVSNLSWSTQPASDRPTAILMLRDSTLFFSGASSASTNANQEQPAIYKLKANGTPDASFGTNGRVLATESGNIHGAFTSIDTLFDAVAGETKVLAMGCADSVATGGVSGFYAARYDLTGAPDALFGSQGKAVFPATLAWAQGFITYDHRILFAGLDTSAHPEILLARMKQDGSPDLSFGTNGVWHTALHLNGSDRSLRAIYDFNQADTALFVIGRLEDTASLSIIRFARDAAQLNRKFGTDGIASLAAVAHFRARSVTISNDGSLLFGGATDTAGGHPMTAKFLDIGRIDETYGNDGYFGPAGTQMLDIHSSAPAEFIAFNSYSVRQNPRLAGAGTITNASGHSQFFAARYMRMGPAFITPDTLDFGAVDTGTTRALTLSVTDTMSLAMTIRAFVVSSPGVFSPDPSTPVLELGPGETKTVEVRYTPDSISHDTAILHVVRPGAIEQSVVLIGEGRVPTNSVRAEDAFSTSILSVSPLVAEDAITITNASSDMATISLYDVAGRAASLRWSIAPHSSRTFSNLGISTGIYYVNGRIGERWVSQKITIQH